MAREIKEDTERKNLTKRGSVWYVKRMVNGEVIVQSTKQTELGKAKMARDRILNATYLKDEKERTEAVLERVQTVDRKLAKAIDALPALTVKHAWDAFLTSPERSDAGEVTLDGYLFQWNRFEKWIEARRPNGELRDVTAKDAADYATDLTAAGLSPNRFNKHVDLLKMVFRILNDTARITVNPWKAISRKRFTVHSRRELTVEELGRLFNTAQGEMRTLLALGTFCGLRLGDAACLEWSSVDMVKSIISLVPRKSARRTHKRVILPIHCALYSMLDNIPPSQRNGYVMPDTAARYQSFNAALAKDVAKLFLSVNIKTNANTKTKSEKETEAKVKTHAKADGKDGVTVKPKGKGDKVKRAVADCGFHSLRHTFVSLCAAGGVPQSVVQSLVGHGSPAMTQHYTHIGLETAQNAIALLPDVTGTQAPQNQKDVADAKLAVVLAQLDGLTDEQLKVAAKKIREIVEKGKSAR